MPHILLWIGGLGVAGWSFVERPFPPLDANPVLDLVHYYTPNFHSAIRAWHYLSPLVAVLLAGLLLLSAWRVWFEARSRSLAPLGLLPDWPLKPSDPGPGIVVGELPHPVAIRQISNPSWLTIPEGGLYTGVERGIAGLPKRSNATPRASGTDGSDATDPERGVHPCGLVWRARRER